MLFLCVCAKAELRDMMVVAAALSLTMEMLLRDFEFMQDRYTKYKVFCDVCVCAMIHTRHQYIIFRFNANNKTKQKLYTNRVACVHVI